MRPTALLLSTCLLLAAPDAARAQQVHRCLGADGQAVYTDQPCSALGASERPSPQPATDGAVLDATQRMFRDGCPRRLSQLVLEIQGAIQARDVNRLASIYDWQGVPRSAAPRILDRLEAMVQNPLVDIGPVYPADPYVSAAPPSTAALPPLPAPPPEDTSTQAASGPPAWMPTWSSGAPEAAQGRPVDLSTLPAPPPRPYTRPRPVGLRVEQVRGGTATPFTTRFSLRRSHGCFWIGF
ncbi:DUF4124 domain-containing protein [Pseudoxanthomonas sp. J35]|uniref:DUF4124 domain-containing protein n=1 Tax=Pseudoxanthomonas sp. J35 TaxID=935852 RepID=UPI00048B763D|nr:DUF4124 domain-containing protein [Pseudoxanthomonas sp. J35]